MTVNTCVFPLVVLLIVGTTWASVTTEPEFEDKTSKCWLKFSGVCVHKEHKCPFVNGHRTEVKREAPGDRLLRSINDTSETPLCAESWRRCCVPTSKEEPLARKDLSCGKSSYDKFRIFGGWRAMPGEWPWQITLKQYGGHHCGGSLIHPLWVLTAAHCLYFYDDIPLENWQVVVSDLNLNIDEKVEQAMDVLEFINHPKFNEPSMANDIALIRLKSPVQLNKWANTICLPNIGEKFEDMICTVTGYGKTETEAVSSVLLEVNKPTIQSRQCQTLHCAAGNPIYTANICGGFEEGLRDACQGDSGGPFVCRKLNTANHFQWILAGVVSYGEGCGSANMPGIYTNVADYLDWIEFTTGLPFYNGSFVDSASFPYDERVFERAASC